MNCMTHSSPDVVLSVENPEAAFCASPNPSFERVRMDLVDDIPILACKMLQYGESQPWSREAEATADGKVNFEHRKRQTKNRGEKDEGIIAPAVKSAVKE